MTIVDNCSRRSSAVRPILAIPRRSHNAHPDRVKWMSSDGQWVVELIRLTATRGQDGDWLRVTHHGFYIGNARDWDGVAHLGVDIGDLRET